MWKKLLGLTIGSVVTAIYKDRKQISLTEEMDTQIKKREAMIGVYEKWVDVIQSGKSISKYLCENGYSDVAIYGIGRIGKQLYNELVASNINVSYIIDRNYSVNHKTYMNTPCVHPEMELETVDLIIITIPNEVVEITKVLNDKISCPVKSIEDVLFVI